MASLREYFVKDGSSNLTIQCNWNIMESDGAVVGAITGRLHLDFQANAKYVSFYIPDLASPESLAIVALSKLSELLALPQSSPVQAHTGGGWQDVNELIFTGLIYFYSERPISAENKQKLVAETKAAGYRLLFKSVEFVDARNKLEKPLAFISHDTRDKKRIAEPLSLQLLKWMCPVWYDEFSLKVGDSLRGSIERGLKESPKCILILTPNFLSNDGWTRVEYDSVFTRERVEKQHVILPVWHDVSPTEVYKYSPVLADRVAVQWSLGVEEVARRLMSAMNAS